MLKKPEHVRHGELVVELEVGCMVNLTEWVPAAEHYQKLDRKISNAYKTIVPLVAINNTVLLNQSIETQAKICHNFVDDAEGKYKLTISVSGDFEKFNYITDSLTVYPMLRIKGVWIEGLCMHNIWEDCVTCCWRDVDTSEPGTEFMGRPGSQELYFETPIYRWLLQHDRNPNYYLKEKNHA